MALIRDLKSPQIDAPHEVGTWIVVRRLNSRRLQEAVDAKLLKAQQRQIARLKALGSENLALKAEHDRREQQQQADMLAKVKASLGAEGVKALDEALALAIGQQTTKPAVADPLDRYDRDTLLALGIVAWSYPDPPAVVFADPDGGLDDETTAWAAHAVLQFNALLPAEADDALGN